MLLPWDDKYLTGIELLDQQHKEMVMMINIFSVKAENKADYHETEEMLDKLVYFAATHFQVEESYMSISGYPDYREHAAVHKQMSFELKRLGIAIKNTEGKNKEIVDETIKFIQDWPAKHIAVWDHKFSIHYRNYLEEQKHED